MAAVEFHEFKHNKDTKDFSRYLNTLLHFPSLVGELSYQFHLESDLFHAQSILQKSLPIFQIFPTLESTRKIDHFPTFFPLSLFPSTECFCADSLDAEYLFQQNFK